MKLADARVLIAEPSHPQSASIEKMLNNLGYYRVVPVASFFELRCLVDAIEAADEAFDYVIANAALASDPGLIEHYCSCCKYIKKSLVYSDCRISLELSSTSVRVYSPPSFELLRSLMSLVTPSDCRLLAVV